MADTSTASRVLLPADPSSARVARRLLAELLADADLAPLADAAELLVSELVTNAVLHAGGDIELGCRVRGGALRVDVGDRSTVLPSRLGPARADAATGRGLELVERLADRWGVDVDVEGGKVVWFELGGPGPAAGGGGIDPGADHHGDGAAPPPRVGPSVPIRLLATPVELVAATLVQGDALLRELALLAFDDEATPWHAPQLDLGPLGAALRTAAIEGRSGADLTVDLPVAAGGGAIARLALVEEAERLAVDGELLAAPGVPEVVACRRWLFGQIALQAEGEAPTAWRLPPPAEPQAAAGPLPEDERRLLDLLGTAAVLADDTNRILAVNAAAARLLGWPADQLSGRRLVEIVPPELRERHLAGFTRHLVTGRSRILGQPVRLPALRRDGSTIEVEVTIDAIELGGGRRGYRAQLR